MKIKLIPIRSDKKLIAFISGEIIILNGETFDLSPLQEGAVISSESISTQWIIGDVSRLAGEIHLTLLLPHGPAAPYETRFPTAFTEALTVSDGLVPLPPYDSELEQPELEVTP